MAQKKDMGKILRQFGLVFVALIIIIFMSITSDVFLTSQNIINILRPVSYTHLDVYKRQEIDSAEMMQILADNLAGE